MGIKTFTSNISIENIYVLISITMSEEIVEIEEKPFKKPRKKTPDEVFCNHILGLLMSNTFLIDFIEPITRGRLAELFKLCCDNPKIIDEINYKLIKKSTCVSFRYTIFHLVATLRDHIEIVKENKGDDILCVSVHKIFTEFLKNSK